MLPRGLNAQTIAQPLKTNPTSGITSNSVLLVQTQPGSTSTVTSSVLPDGAATDASLTTINTTLGSPMQQTGGTVAITGTVPVSAASLPLPTGASTEATLASVDTHIQTVNTTLGSPMQQTGGTVTCIAPVITMTHSTVTTGAVSSTALAANSSAKYRFFQNVDLLNAISIAVNVAAVANTQITLFPKDTYTMSLVNGNMDTRQINCIAAAGIPTLLVTEGV